MVKAGWTFGVVIVLGVLTIQHVVAEESPPEKTVTLAGTVVMPDGSPAGEVIVSAWGNNWDRRLPATARTDREGRFEIRSTFGVGCKLHARSADGANQATLLISPAGDRIEIAKPVVVKLLPARHIAILVLRDGKPVQDAQVAASGTVENEYHVNGQTGADGKARLAVPHGKISYVAAWHGVLGVDGRYAENGVVEGVVVLELRPSRTHRFRAVDASGEPVAKVQLGAEIGLGKGSWIMTADIPQATLTTDSAGSVSVPWMPTEGVRHINCDSFDPQWKLDGIEDDPQKLKKDETLIYLRRKVAVQGRLKMPAGASAAGISIRASGFGPRNRVDFATARAEADGSFRLSVVADHGYSIGVIDSEWACDDWTGMVLAHDGAAPAAIELEMYRATPCEVWVTRDDAKTPVANIWVEVEQEKGFKWRTASGEERIAAGGRRYWTKTNAEGFMKTGVGRGKLKFSIRQDGWDEEKETRIKDDKPVEVSIALPPPIFGERPPKPPKILNLE